jgi:hypothetical protein
MSEKSLSEGSLFQDNAVKLRDKLLAEETPFHIRVYCDDCQIPRPRQPLHRPRDRVKPIYLLDHLLLDRKEMNVSITVIKH